MLQMKVVKNIVSELKAFCICFFFSVLLLLFMPLGLGLILICIVYALKEYHDPSRL